MTAFIRRFIVAALLWTALPGAASAQVPDCDKDLDACIRWAVAEVATYADECAKTFPDRRADFDAALANWRVLKLPIRGLNDAIKPGSLQRITLARKVAPYLKSIGAYEREIECFGRLAMLKNTQPRLYADSVILPGNALARYME
jgi:hypothetical protein